MILDDLARKYNPDADRAKVPLPPLPEGVDVVIAFDQALDKVGVVRYDGTSTAAWTIRSPQETKDLTGHERTLARSVALQQAALDVLGTACSEAGRIVVIHETPAVAKGKMARPESSLLGAHCIRWAAHVADMDPTWGAEVRLLMVSAQRAKAVVTGNARADKVDVHAALKATYAPEHVGVATNEDERDAMALLVTYLKDAS